ncbi:hypothetical protein [Photobacterium damselae]|uniref:hypothetical protein n=1 Tax=Photobacterium damselae TaxID=38293 RepID=UPI001EDE7D3F|nr:hypothetical protein [Photobacterium damselae]MCG3824313.1 hypothetical protein [Photobacterium damselae]
MKKHKTIKKRSVLKNILSTDYSKNTKIKRIFSQLTPQELRFASRDLLINNKFSDLILLNRTGKTNKIYDYTIPNTSLDKSLYWSLGVIINNVEKIKSFLTLENKLIDNILLNNYDKAINLLDEIDIICGISIWSLSLRSSILSEQGKTNESLFDLISDSDQYSVFSVIFKCVITKNDLTDSVLENRFRIDRQLQNSFLPGSDDLYNILKYKILSFKPTDAYDFEHIFNFEKNTTLIDLYACCCDFVIFSISNNKNNALVNECLSVLSKHLKGSIFDRIGDGFIKKTNFECNIINKDLLDNYTKGNYNYCNEFVSNMTSNISFSHVEIASKSCCRIKAIETHNNLGRIINSLSKFLTKEKEYHSAKNEIYKIQNKYRDLSFFKKLIMYVEFAEERANKKEEFNYKKIIYLMSKIDSPFRSEFIFDDSKEKYINDIINVGYKESLYIWQLYNGNIENSDAKLHSVDNKRHKLYYAKKLMKNGFGSIATDILKELSFSDDVLIKYEASNELMIYYISNNESVKALNIYNNLVLKNRNSIYLFDNAKIILAAELLLSQDLLPSAIISLSLYSRFIDTSKSSQLRAVFNALMRSCKCTNPIELNNLLNYSWENEYFIYFLSYVCTPEIMKFCNIFKSPTDIDKCRINICNHLMLINENKDKFGDEVKNITKKLVLREATIQVAQSKVYADISSFKTGENEAHYSLYKKYQESVNKNKEQFENGLVLLELAKILESELSEKQVYYTENRVFSDISSIFIKLVRIIIEEFSFGSKGLNANISTRIRHGHLPNTIRRSLLNENLITAISQQANIVRNNEYWLGKLPPECNVDDINKVLNNFTKEVDDIIHTLNEEILQVSTLDENISKLSSAEKPLFSYKPTDMEIATLQVKINISTSYNDFINMIESWLWDITEENLKNIREYINNNVSDFIIDGLIENISSIEKLDKSWLYEFTNAANRAKTALRQDVNTIISWFKKTQINTTKDFEFDTAVQIASQALLLEIPLNIDESIVIKGDKLSSFVDILYILYENSISKSKLEKDELECFHSVSLDNGYLKIIYNNKCLEYKSAKDKNNEISDYINTYGDEEIMMQRLHSEGGTGFAKIWKIIDKDLNKDHELKFWFDDSCFFNVNLNIDIKGYLINENINC